MTAGEYMEWRRRGRPNKVAYLKAIGLIVPTSAEIIAGERERCAKIAEHLNGWGNPPAPELADHIAQIIRER